MNYRSPANGHANFCSVAISMTTRQYARLVSEWIRGVGLDPRLCGTHSLKATLIFRRTGNLRGLQLLLGHTKIESMGPISRDRGR